MKNILPILLMVWPYLPLPICYVPGEELRNQVFVAYLVLTVVVYIANVVNAFKLSDAKKSALFDMLLKIIHIPFYLVVFVVGVAFLCASVVPALLFVTPFLVFMLVVIDVLLMLTTSMYGINAIGRAFKAKKVTGKFALVNIVLHFFFVTDIISSVVVFCKLRKNDLEGV